MDRLPSLVTEVSSKAMPSLVGAGGLLTPVNTGRRACSGAPSQRERKKYGVMTLLE